jgi:RHS repeat-associated protein
MQILYTYDDLNRITEIKRYVDGQNDEILFDNPQYDGESLLTQFDYGNDIRATYTYDSRDRLLTIEFKDGATSLLDLDYTYDSTGNITQLINGWRDTSSTWHSETESYSYDGLDRLISASCTSWSHTYTYDKSGNRIGTDSLAYTINSIDEVTALNDGTSFTYDDNGNRIQKTKGDDTWNYTYDYANRLTEIEANQSTMGEYVYDGNGKRLQKIENSTTTFYIYSGSHVLYEETSTGIATYIYGPNGKLAKRTTIDQESHIYYYHSDGIQSMRLVTDGDKQLISSVTYHPFGNTYHEEGSEDYLFTGMALDSSGLYYVGARYYDAELGRFITKDRISGDYRYSQTLNRYTYCLNNPLKYVDLDGHLPRTLHDIGQGPFSTPPKPEPPPKPVISASMSREEIAEALEEHEEAMEEYEKKMEWWEKEYGGTVFGEPCDCEWTLPYQYHRPEYPIEPETMLEEVIYQYMMNNQSTLGENASFSGEYETLFIILATMGFIFDSIEALIEYIEKLNEESDEDPEPEEDPGEPSNTNIPPTEPKVGERYAF